MSKASGPKDQKLGPGKKVDELEPYRILGGNTVVISGEGGQRSVVLPTIWGQCNKEAHETTRSAAQQEGHETTRSKQAKENKREKRPSNGKSKLDSSASVNFKTRSGVSEYTSTVTKISRPKQNKLFNRHRNNIKCGKA